MKKSKCKWVIGIDEVGRGPIAGPVTVCALIIPVSGIHEFKGSTLKGSQGRTLGLGNFDSKQHSPKQREQIFAKIKKLKNSGKLDYAISSVSNKVIDKKGIVFAINLAISRALKSLDTQFGYPVTESKKNVQVLLDGGLHAPSKYKNQKTIIHGDALEPVIGLASIVAKVHRDRYMTNLAARQLSWGFDKHKGYGTREHYKAIKKHGPSSIHRVSFNLTSKSN